MNHRSVDWKSDVLVAKIAYLMMIKYWMKQVRAAAVVFYLLGKLQVEGVMRDL